MQTLSRQHSLTEEIKKSRFVATGVPVGSAEEALEKLAALSDSQATHNCWAYRIGDAYRFNDDGEPGGTAGRPILAAIEGRELDRVLVVVTRFFGGIKLGAGGLVRAYGGTASRCLNEAPKTPIVERVVVEIVAPFELTGAVYPVLREHETRKLDEAHTTRGLTLTLELARDELDAFGVSIADATSGRAELKLKEVNQNE